MKVSAELKQAAGGHGHAEPYSVGCHAGEAGPARCESQAQGTDSDEGAPQGQGSNARTGNEKRAQRCAHPAYEEEEAGLAVCEGPSLQQSGKDGAGEGHADAGAGKGQVDGGAGDEGMDRQGLHS